MVPYYSSQWRREMCELFNLPFKTFLDYRTLRRYVRKNVKKDTFEVPKDIARTALTLIRYSSYGSSDILTEEQFALFFKNARGQAIKVKFPNKLSRKYDIRGAATVLHATDKYAILQYVDKGIRRFDIGEQILVSFSARTPIHFGRIANFILARETASPFTPWVNVDGKLLRHKEPARIRI